MTEPQPEEDTLLQRVASFVEAPTSSATAMELVSACLGEARGLVTVGVGTTWTDPPTEVLDRAIIEVAADLYHRRATRLGVAGFADNDLNPVRITRDPMASARPILAPYLAGGFA